MASYPTNIVGVRCICGHPAVQYDDNGWRYTECIKCNLRAAYTLDTKTEAMATAQPRGKAHLEAGTPCNDSLCKGCHPEPKQKPKRPEAPPPEFIKEGTFPRARAPQAVRLARKWWADYHKDTRSKAPMDPEVKNVVSALIKAVEELSGA